MIEAYISITQLHIAPDCFMERLIALANRSLNCLKLFQIVAFKPSNTCTPIATQLINRGNSCLVEMDVDARMAQKRISSDYYVNKGADQTVPLV